MSAKGHVHDLLEAGIDEMLMLDGPAESYPTASLDDQPDTELNLEKIERDTIQRALSRNRYNISHAARDLGLTRAALYRRMEKHGL